MSVLKRPISTDGLTRHQQDMAKRFQSSHDRCSLLHNQTSERVGKQWLAAERVAVIPQGRASAAGIAPFTPHDMRRTYIEQRTIGRETETEHAWGGFAIAVVA